MNEDGCDKCGWVLSKCICPRPPTPPFIQSVNALIRSFYDGELTENEIKVRVLTLLLSPQHKEKVIVDFSSPSMVRIIYPSRP